MPSGVHVVTTFNLVYIFTGGHYEHRLFEAPPQRLYEPPARQSHHQQFQPRYREQHREHYPNKNDAFASALKIDRRSTSILHSGRIGYRPYVNHYRGRFNAGFRGRGYNNRGVVFRGRGGQRQSPQVDSDLYHYRGRGRGRFQRNTRPSVSKNQLDSELDSYMAASGKAPASKSNLDRQLDAYMSQKKPQVNST